MPKLYAKNTWQDEVLSGAERYDIETDGGAPIETNVQINLATSVAQAGTPVDADKMNNIENGIDDLDDLLNSMRNDATELTINSDAITITQSNHKLQPQSGTADNLSTINGTVAGQSGVLYCSDFGTDTITIKHAVGNIRCMGANDITLTTGCVFWYSNGTIVFISGGGGGGISDGDKGDITVSGSGATLTIDNDAVTFAKMQNVAANSVPARAAGTSGDLSEVALAASQLLGRGSTGNVAPIALGTGLSMSGATLNSVGVRMSADSPRVYTSGATWNKPAGLHHVIVEVVGGGGGGGGVASAAGQAACAGAGGGGEYAKGRFNAASLGATVTVTIGAGGTGGAAGANNGTAGGNSSFGSHISANGGGGGTGQAASATVPRTSAPAGDGGTGGTGGSIRVAGDPGFPGLNVTTSITQASMGGGNPLGGRVKDALTDNSLDTDGADGLQYGGGGSGARASNTTTNYAGGDGASGVVIVWEYLES